MAIKISAPVAASGRTVSSVQAREIAALFPLLLRRLSAGIDDPVSALPLAQLRVCLILREGPQAMSALSRELGVSVSAMTQIADRLERTHLVKRVSNPTDRRVRRLQLTPRGEKMIRRHDDTRAVRMAEVLRHLTAKERDCVADILRRMVRAADAANGKHGRQKLDGPHIQLSRITL